MGDTEGALRGRSALVTGGGSGIGLACARHLVRDGASVTIAGRTEDRLRAASDALGGEARHGATVAWVVCDVTDEAAVAAAVERAADRTGRLDIAIANAGGGAVGSVLSMPVEMWHMTLGVNLTGTFLTIKHAAQAMVRGDGGAIVAISSIAGVLTHRFMSAYCVSKAGIEMLVRNAADELGARGVRVNAVRPGLVPTDLSGPLSAETTVVDDYHDQMPLHRLGTVDDIAAGVRYLAGPESSWVTGQVFAIDGGHSLRRGPRVDAAVAAFFGPEVAAELAPRR